LTCANGCLRREMVTNQEPVNRDIEIRMYNITNDMIRNRNSTMSNETADKMVTMGVARADSYKIQTAEALEEAARKLRNADISAKGEDVRTILSDVEYHVNQFKSDVSAGFQNVEAEYHKKVEPVEHIIIEHPIPAVLIAAGIGVLIGMLIFKSRD
jgi:ElaB/YqjD/DUF883 family membrane-anchored ribosome-binding protein